MSKIIVLGGGVCGLAAGMVSRRDGHDVTILERDRQPAPGSADEAWRAGSVTAWFNSASRTSFFRVAGAPGTPPPLFEPDKSYWRKTESPAAGRAPKTETHVPRHLRPMSRDITAMPPAGFEPATLGLKVRCSAN